MGKGAHVKVREISTIFGYPFLYICTRLCLSFDSWKSIVF